MSDGGTSSPNPTPASGSSSVGETRTYRPGENIYRTGIPGPC